MQLVEQEKREFMEWLLGPAEDDEGWSQYVFKHAYDAGFQAGMRYAASITERQGRGWGLQHAEEIRRHDTRREEASQ